PDRLRPKDRVIAPRLLRRHPRTARIAALRSPATSSLRPRVAGIPGMVGWPGIGLALLLAEALGGVAAAQDAPAPAPAPAASSTEAAADEFFEKSVRPLLADRCWRCHGDERQKSELRLDSRAALLAGGKHGPAAVERKPEESLLIEAIRRDGARKMPP